MSEHEPSKGFKVTDRRSFTASGDPRVPTESSAPEEREHAAPEAEIAPPVSGEPRHEAQFLDLLSLLATQATLALGEPNPITGERQQDVQGARVLISMIEVLKAKTEGNLAADEANALDEILYALRMSFIRQAKGQSIKE